MDLRTEDFNYTLPPELIAQEPAAERAGSRLMVLDRRNQSILHTRFDSLPLHLNSGDMVVANRSRVIPARLAARKPSGGAVELLLLRPYSPLRWMALARPSRKLRPGMPLLVAETEVCATLLSDAGDGLWEIEFSGPGDVAASIRLAGTVPLPPYIHSHHASPERYQTVYADQDGSVAAPTAGLHFSETLLRRLRSKGIGVRFVTLHVGLGTFRPVAVDRISDHTMHAEWGELPEEVAQAAAATRAEGGRIVAVGTTTTRLLESSARDGQVRAFRGDTDIFIYPGHNFRAVDALVTNFHLPRSSLLMLVSAFAGREFILHAYHEAIRERYRFYSFGDAMLII